MNKLLQSEGIHYRIGCFWGKQYCASYFYIVFKCNDYTLIRKFLCETANVSFRVIHVNFLDAFHQNSIRTIMEIITVELQLNVGRPPQQQVTIPYNLHREPHRCRRCNHNRKRSDPGIESVRTDTRTLHHSRSRSCRMLQDCRKSVDTGWHSKRRSFPRCTSVLNSRVTSALCIEGQAATLHWSVAFSNYSVWLGQSPTGCL